MQKHSYHFLQPPTPSALFDLIGVVGSFRGRGLLWDGDRVIGFVGDQYALQELLDMRPDLRDQVAVSASEAETGRSTRRFRFTVALDDLEQFEMEMMVRQVAGWHLLMEDGQIVGFQADESGIATLLHHHPRLSGHLVADSDKDLSSGYERHAPL